MRGPGLRPACQRGLALIELLVAVVLLAMIAAALPPLMTANSHPAQATAAANRVAAALRFAHDEALRTATPTIAAFSAGSTSDAWRLGALQTVGASSTVVPILNPLSRQTSAETTGAGSAFPDARLSSVPVVLITTNPSTGATTTSTTTGAVGFLADGSPAVYSGTALLRLSGSDVLIHVQAGSSGRDVQVAAETGRVTVQ